MTEKVRETSSTPSNSSNSDFGAGSTEKVGNVVHLENGGTAGLPPGIPVSQDAAELLAELEALDPVAQKQLRSKYDKRILPVVTLIYMMAFIDRSNMGSEFS